VHERSIPVRHIHEGGIRVTVCQLEYQRLGRLHIRVQTERGGGREVTQHVLKGHI